MGADVWASVASGLVGVLLGASVASIRGIGPLRDAVAALRLEVAKDLGDMREDIVRLEATINLRGR